MLICVSTGTPRPAYGTPGARPLRSHQAIRYCHPHRVLLRPTPLLCRHNQHWDASPIRIKGKWTCMAPRKGDGKEKEQKPTAHAHAHHMHTHRTISTLHTKTLETRLENSMPNQEAPCNGKLGRDSSTRPPQKTAPPGHSTPCQYLQVQREIAQATSCEPRMPDT
jgi:hypothetical protein